MKSTRLLFTMLCLLSFSALVAQTNTVTGTITDGDGNPLEAVSIIVKGTSTSTLSNVSGHYSIVAAENATLVFSFVGFSTIEERVVGNVIDVQLFSNAGELEGVVVTAMGIKKEQRKLGYAVSTVSSEQILKAAPTNFGSALYGKAPGVNINSSAGGGSSAVSIDIRGNMNSLNFQAQPLIVVDGVITRNEQVNNDGFWGDQRIRGNGILDMNPENIESINILKGAAASALYGSDAAAGVIVITTKGGKGANGLGVDVNANYGMERVAVLPDYQFDYGPGYARTVNQSNFGANNAGFIERTVTGGRVYFGDPANPATSSIPAPAGYANGDIIRQPIMSAWGQFGPKFDGQDAIYWDGQIRPYQAYTNNYKNFFNDGSSGIYNVAVYNSTDKMNYRFSYTRNEYRSVMESGPQRKNTFNLNTSFKVSPRLTIDLIANYVNEHINNRPYMVDRMTNNYTGFLSPAQDIEWFQRYYQTTKGYKYVTFGDRNRDPDEAFVFGTAGTDYMEYYWNQRRRQYNEYTNRLIASSTITYKILDDLVIRGRLGTDYTGYYSENKGPNEYPTTFGSSGSFDIQNNRFTFFYGDLLLSYNKKISDNFGLNLQAGYQARKEQFNRVGLGTAGGLSERDWFSINASLQTARNTGANGNQVMVKDGLFAMVGAEINNYWFVDATIRQERASTLIPDNNTFYYPSVSSSFELSNAFNLPTFVNYSKVRASFGIVGNPAPMYTANVVYNAYPASGTPTLVLPDTYGNANLKNETKREFEIGWENRMFNNRFDFEVTYYNNLISDMIVALDVAPTTGVSRVMQNVGNMRNYGLELGFGYKAIQSHNFNWDTRINFAFNRNRLTELANNLEVLQHSNVDNGSLYVNSKVGSPAGDIYTYKLQRHANGELLVGADGFYLPDYSQTHVVGNIQPKVVGGFINTFSYKNFSLTALVDFRFGGQIYSPSIQYGISAGMYKETLFGRDAANGGVSYYVNADGDFVSAANAPAGATIFDDGMILQGVDANGRINETIIESKEYYRLGHYWGQYPGSNRPGTYETAVFDNDFIKMRELTFTYQLPVSIAGKVKAKSLSVSAYGRNLFFFHKTLPHLDPEATVGTNWITRANVGNAGVVPRSMGLSLRASF